MIDRLMEGGAEVDVVRTRLQVQQTYGMHINPHTTTVSEFAKIIELIKAQANKRQAQTETNG